MELALTEEQRRTRDEVRRFAENETEPIASKHDRAEEYPHEVMDAAKETHT